MTPPIEALLGAAGRLLLEATWAASAVALLALALERLLRRAPAGFRAVVLAIAAARFLWPPALGLPWGADAGGAAVSNAAASMPERAFAWATAAALAVWVVGFVARALRLANVHASTAAWLAGRGPDAALERRIEALALRMGLPRAPRVVLHPDVRVPFVVGARRPALVLPVAGPHAEAALLHELAHVKRGDLWLREAAAWAGAVWWWHPLFHAVVARLRAAQEEACDDLAIATAGVEPASYGALLVAAARTARGQAEPRIAAISGFDGRSLERRLRRVLDPSRPARARLGAGHVLVLLALLAFALPRAAAPAFGLRLLPGADAPHVHVHPHSHRH